MKLPKVDPKAIEEGIETEAAPGQFKTQLLREQVVGVEVYFLEKEVLRDKPGHHALFFIYVFYVLAAHIPHNCCDDNILEMTP